MQNKTNRWLEVQVVIATLALTYGLVLWNFFAGASRPVTTTVAPNPQTRTISISASQPQAQLQGRIFFGGAAPGSAPAFSAPAPVAITGSSRP